MDDLMEIKNMPVRIEGTAEITYRILWGLIKIKKSQPVTVVMENATVHFKGIPKSEFWWNKFR